MLALGLMLAAGCGQEPATVAETPGGPPIEVATQVAASQPVADTVTVTGTVEPSRRASPGTKILGRVATVPVEEGQRVRSGQLLARLDDRDLRAAVHQAEAAVAMAEAQRTNALAQYERMQELIRRGAVTTKNLEDATAGYRVAEAGVAQAQANLDAARVTLGYAEVTSPLDGWVVTKRIEQGDMVAPGQPLFVVEDLEPVKVVAEVPERDVTGLAEGDVVRVELDALDLAEEARIERLVPSGDRQARTFELHTLLPNPEGRLKSGMFARVQLSRGSREALLVPRDAVVARGQLEGLFVVDDQQRAHLRWVRTGSVIGDQVELLSGLSPGERFVLAPPATLTDGATIRERERS